MSSVTARIKEIKQPRGGYLKPSSLEVIDFSDGKILNEKENVHYSIIGMVVDYLTRFMMGEDIREAFKFSILGAEEAKEFIGDNVKVEFDGYLNGIKGLDNKSIINACKVTTFDVWFRNPFDALLAKSAKEVNPDKDTITNIKILVERSISFWEKYGPIKVVGFTFGDKGYTETVDSGDGDFLTQDTMWDFKVSKRSPTNKHTLQLLMYYIMGTHSEKPEFKGINKIGIFNPRLNKAFLCDLNNISADTIKEIEDNIICYKS